MRNIVFGTIGVLWGGAILISRILSEAPAGNEAYQSGQSAGLLFGLLMLIVGAYYLKKGIGQRSALRKRENEAANDTEK